MKNTSREALRQSPTLICYKDKSQPKPENHVGEFSGKPKIFGGKNGQMIYKHFLRLEIFRRHSINFL
jgi:hypothetical protein